MIEAIWYGDRRDRVKWGGLIHLAESSDISHIVQVAYYREDTYPVLTSNDYSFPLPETVWRQFSDLRNIQHLAQASGRNIKVIDLPFRPDSRHEYITSVTDQLKRIKNPNSRHTVYG